MSNKDPGEMAMRLISGLFLEMLALIDRGLLDTSVERNLDFQLQVSTE